MGKTIKKIAHSTSEIEVKIRFAKREMQRSSAQFSEHFLQNILMCH